MIDSLPEKAQEVYDEGFEAGRALSQEDAYDEGFEAGRNAGYEAGKSDGYDDGAAAGYTKGSEDNEWIEHVAGLIQDRIYRLHTLHLDADLTSLEHLEALLDEVRALA